MTSPHRTQPTEKLLQEKLNVRNVPYRPEINLYYAAYAVHNESAIQSRRPLQIRPDRRRQMTVYHGEWLLCENWCIETTTEDHHHIIININIKLHSTMNGLFNCLESRICHFATASLECDIVGLQPETLLSKYTPVFVNL